MKRYTHQFTVEWLKDPDLKDWMQQISNITQQRYSAAHN